MEFSGDTCCLVEGERVSLPFQHPHVEGSRLSVMTEGTGAGNDPRGTLGIGDGSEEDEDEKKFPEVFSDSTKKSYYCPPFSPIFRN